MRRILIVLIALICIEAQAQNDLAVLRRAGFVRSSSAYILDNYSDAVGAYSLRVLSSDFINSDLINARRTSDDAEAGFTATEITDGTLETWSAGGDVYVTIWYDQSGNENNQVQSDTSLQPKLVSSGTNLYTNLKPSLRFDTSDTMAADITGFQSISNLSMFYLQTPDAAAAPNTTSARWLYWGDISSQHRGIYLSSSSGTIVGETICLAFENITQRRIGSSSYARAAEQQQLISLFLGQSGTLLYSDGNSVTLDITAAMTTNTPSSPFDTGYTLNDNVKIFVQPCTVQEVIFFDANKASVRENIESNINIHYSIY